MQTRAGVREKAEQIGSRFIRSEMPEEHREFFANLRWVVVANLRNDGNPAIGLIGGAPGFLAAPDPGTLTLESKLDPSDPLSEGFQPGRALGFLGIQLADRRRNRVNGSVIATDNKRTTIAVNQSFGNCPAYIQKRDDQPVKHPGKKSSTRETVGDPSTIQAFLSTRDTFFIASRFEDAEEAKGSGVDASHRGGKPGFVQLRQGILRFPDFSGNKFFNTLGNITADPRVALVFPDFESGDLLYINGEASVVWEGATLEAFEGAERLVEVRPLEVFWRRAALPFRVHAPAQPSPALNRTGTW